MARTIQQIKKMITGDFMSNPVIQEKYGLTGKEDFENAFSQVSVENILFGIVASAIYILESLFDVLRKEVDEKIADAIIASVPWYHKIALQFQYGDSLTLDEYTQRYVYENIDTSKQVVRYASCRDEGGYVYILVAGEKDGLPAKLDDNVMVSFRAYINQLKPAGIVTEIYSYDPDKIIIDMAIEYNPLILNPDGSQIDDLNKFPVEDAIVSYLGEIRYGGVFNKTHLVDAVQKVSGVTDIILRGVKVKSSNIEDFIDVAGNNYQSQGGSFIPVDMRRNISYEVQI